MQLTRFMLRQLVRGEPILYRQCLYRHFSSRRLRYPPSNLRPVRNAPRRSFFAFPTMMPAGPTSDPHVDPGMPQMIEVSKRLQQGLRPLESTELQAAFRGFFETLGGRTAAVEDVQAELALQTFLALMETPAPEGKTWLGNRDLAVAMRVLGRQPTGKTDAHRELAKALYRLYEDKGIGGVSKPVAYTSSNAVNASIDTHTYEEVRNDYSRVLCFSGAADEAHEMLKGQEATGDRVPDATWLHVFEGYAAEGKEDELHRLVQELGDRSAQLGDDVRDVMVRFYAARGRYVKRWYKGRVFGSSRPDERALNTLVRFCLEKRDVKLGQEVIQDALESNPTKVVRDLALLWAASNGKSTDEIERMINVMASTASGGDNGGPPDIESINILVEYAVSKNEAYAAERYRNLGKRLGFEPDGRAYLLTMQIRLIANDLPEALQTYHELKSTAIQFEANEDVPIANQLITALCSSELHDIDTIMPIADDLYDRGAPFYPDTIRALSLLHLQRDELQDLVQLLKAHAPRFSAAQRASLLTTFVDYALNPAQPTDRVWDACTIIHDLFGEVDRDTRTRLMEDLFRRGRADKACLLFNHMRESFNPSIRATANTYVAALVGIATCGHLKSLRNVHNQLKVDIHVTPDTRLRNALILAYTSCGDPASGMFLWDSIYHSREGPSFNSFRIVFWTCESVFGGAEAARPIWETLNGLPGVEIPKDVFVAYLGALAGSSELKEAIHLVETELGYPPDATMLGTIFNATPEIHRQNEVEAWAQERFPGIWAELEQLGAKEMANGARRFDIDRILEP